VSATAGDARATVTFRAPTLTGGSPIRSYTVTSFPDGVTARGSGTAITVTGLTNGTKYSFTVTATNAIGTGSASAASNGVTPTRQQTITFANPGDKSFGTTPTLTASSTSGLPVSFTSVTNGVCTITSGGTLTFVSPGACTINADQAGNGIYGAATRQQQRFTVKAVAPGAATSVSAIAVDKQVKVSFTAPTFTGGPTITGYTVTSFPDGITARGSSSPIAVTGLTPGRVYTFTVTATNSAGTGVPSAPSASVTAK